MLATIPGWERFARAYGWPKPTPRSPSSVPTAPSPIKTRVSSSSLRFKLKIKPLSFFVTHSRGGERGCCGSLSPHLPESAPRELAPDTGLAPRRLPRLLGARPSTALDERHGLLLRPVTGQLQHDSPRISILHPCSNTFPGGNYLLESLRRVRM